MKRILLAAIITISTFGPPAVLAAGDGPCTAERYEVHHNMSSTKQHEAAEALIRCAVRKWPVDGGAAKALAVAECESSLYAWASSNGNEGLYQIRNWEGARSTWLQGHHWYFPRWIHSSGAWKPGPYNARANVFVAIRWASAIGWDNWSCA